MAFSRDGRRLASANGGVHTPGEIKIWDPADGRELSTLPAHTAPVRGLAFSPAGRMLASFSLGISPGGMILPGEVKFGMRSMAGNSRAYPGPIPRNR